MPKREPLPIVERSFLRGADPRTKLILSLSASMAVMLPLPQLAIFGAFYLALVMAAGITAHAATYVRRIGPLLAILFAVDWLFIGFEFAVLITLRMSLLVSAFSLLVATTTADELRAGIEQLGLPRRLAFAFTTAFCSLGLMEAEWTGILEAQRARGILAPASGSLRQTKGALRRRRWRQRAGPERQRAPSPALPAGEGWGEGFILQREQLAAVVALVVPAIVLVTQRAWSINEAAAVRGFESPIRRPFDVPRLTSLDVILLLGAAFVLGGLFVWR